MARGASQVAPARSARASAGPGARIEFDLQHELLAEGRFPLLGSLEGIFHERPVEERAPLTALAVGLLRALHDAGYRRAERWEVDPGGWLPLPEAPHPGRVEPIAHLLRAMESEAWRPLADARGFTILASAGDERSATAVLRRFHRERQHTLSIEVDRSSRRDCEELIRAVRERLPVVRARVSAAGTVG